MYEIYGSKKLKWPMHTREDAEALLAEWKRPDGVILVDNTERRENELYWSGVFRGALCVATVLFCLFAFWGN